jgi:NADH-quinone oxidoreductase subunit C
VSGVRELLERVAGEFGERVRAVPDLRGEPAFRAERDAARAFLRRLRDDEVLRFDFLPVVTAVDNYPGEPRFEVVYVVRSLAHNVDARVNVPVPSEDPEVDTVADLWPAANWMEREVWDMFGVRFRGHPDLTRILMWEGFEGHPLRKDYPLLGNSPGTPGYVGKGAKP